MDPLVIIGIANSAFDLLERILPVIDGMVQRGEISAAQQAEVRAKAESLRNKTNGQFSGPHWQIDPDPPATPDDPVPAK